MAKYRVLSFDGGGIRGLLTTIMLQRISAEHGLGDFIGKANLLAGTSTGGLIALCLAAGTDLHVIRDIFQNEGQEIFKDSIFDDIADIGKLIGAEYDNTALRNILGRLFSTLLLGELDPKKVLINSFDLDNEYKKKSERRWKPKVFHNFVGDNNDRNESIVNIAMYTSAAPTYFPSVNGYIDGGVFANNPSMCALAQTQDTRYLSQPLNSVYLLSFGTGTSLQYIKGKTHDWGYAQWAKPLISLMFDGVNEIADYQCKQFLGNRYHRLAPFFLPGTMIPLDEVDKIPEMIEFATTSIDISKTVEWIEQQWMPDDPAI